jgi:hypothetical protein
MDYKKLLFPLGGVFITPGAKEVLQCSYIEPGTLLFKHSTGDFGEAGLFDEITVTEEELRDGPFATSEDGKLNKVAILSGEGRIFSIYPVGNEKLWVITEHDNSATTILLPDEY